MIKELEELVKKWREEADESPTFIGDCTWCTFGNPAMLLNHADDLEGLIRHLTSRPSRAARAEAEPNDEGYKKLFGILAQGRSKPPPA